MVNFLQKLFPPPSTELAKTVITVEKVVQQTVVLEEMTNEELQKQLELIKREILSRKHKQEAAQQAVCDHDWHEYANRQGDVTNRECHKCWLLQRLENSNWHTAHHW